MKFINYCGHWHELDFDCMKMWNYKGGYMTINENDEHFMTAECREFESWHECYKETGYMPWETERFIENDIWIAPNGEYVVCNSHEGAAEEILEVLYGVEYEHGIYDHGDKLINEYGWIKASRWFWDMHLSYLTNGWDMTKEQAITLKKWCEYFRITYPAHIIIERRWFI